MVLAPAFAFDEQYRAEGLAVRAEEIATTPDHPSAGSLYLYQESARAAFETAAAHTVQPDEGWRL
ncbi:hypothetical protein F2B00_22125 [Streptomyces parvus]|uniref:hypothetical protein n=1 Tax=Streptomyces parvus TaxID=66428 RepID=UPI00123C75E6|nr:hypothetical protein [Streptomyces parvus]KAA6200079.1 hypothetical protein F2B00_22125 [Streptomyces parvus]GGS41494.1 hypothetical protein GCM10010221_45380 [Streptomyces parvus]